jgi:putative Mn2+ efflux pump MntP
MVALLVVAVALGLNNFGAAIAIGVSGVDRRTEIKVATVFGLCDVVMPAIGMLIGTRLAGPLGSAARWAGAGILFVTAVWGLIEALRGGDDTPQIWHGWRLLVSGAALSLDDLAVGLALGTVRYPIVLAVALFGLMSFVMSIIGLRLGGRLGTAAGEHGEVVGAIVLIGISGAMAMGWLLGGRDAYVNLASWGVPGDPSRGQVTQADHAAHLAAFEHREVPEAVQQHELEGVLDRGVRGCLLRVLGHPRGHRGTRQVATGCRGAQHVPLGENAGQETALHDQR